MIRGSYFLRELKQTHPGALLFSPQPAENLARAERGGQGGSWTTRPGIYKSTLHGVSLSKETGQENRPPILFCVEFEQPKLNSDLRVESLCCF